MRLSTIGSVVALALSGAAMARVAGTPIEPKTRQNAADNMTLENGAPATGDNAAGAPANDMIPVPDSTAGAAPPKG